MRLLNDKVPTSMRFAGTLKISAQIREWPQEALITKPLGGEATRSDSMRTSNGLRESTLATMNPIQNRAVNWIPHSMLSMWVPRYGYGAVHLMYGRRTLPRTLPNSMRPNLQSDTHKPPLADDGCLAGTGPEIEPRRSHGHHEFNLVSIASRYYLSLTTARLGPPGNSGDGALANVAFESTLVQPAPKRLSRPWDLVEYRPLFSPCSVRRRSALPNDANQYTLKSQLCGMIAGTGNTAKSSSCTRATWPSGADR